MVVYVMFLSYPLVLLDEMPKVGSQNKQSLPVLRLMNSDSDLKKLETYCSLLNTNKSSQLVLDICFPEIISTHWLGFCYFIAQRNAILMYFKGFPFFNK